LRWAADTAPMIPDDQPTPSKATATKYQLLKELGRGGMGVVHLAMSRGPQGFTKLVVLKMMRRALVGDFDSHRMFLEEARISARLTHPNVVDVYEVIDYGEMPTIVMEYLEGQPLSAILNAPTGPNPPRNLLLYILTKVLAGLGAAHDLRDYDGTPFNLIHRDASPHNVFVLYDGQVKVLDFGIAKAERSEVETQAGTLKGKIRYMPPEQLMHLSQDRRVDLFTAGVILWEMLVGQRFWGSRTDDEVVRELSAKRLPALPIGANVPPELAAICARALAPDPADRYATADEFQRDLERVLAAQPERIGTAELSRFMREGFSNERESAKWLIEAQIRETMRLDDKNAEDHTRAAPRNPAPQPTPPSPSPPRRRSKWIGFIALPGVVVVASLLLLAGVFAGQRRDTWDRPPQRSTRVGASPAPGPAEICKGGSKLCGGICVSVDSPERGCGAEGCTACNVTNATARCNQLDRCDVAVCHKGFEDCDGDGVSGCEVNLRTDPDHCGDCAHKCPAIAHAQRGCGDVCTIWRCAVGFRDCDGRVADGCEVDIRNDARNCGHCGRVCTGGRKCRAGVCS
jgi:serine/threonine protein kinase